MVNEEFLRYVKHRLIQCAFSGDTEAAHVQADEVLCELLAELGFKEIVDLFHEVDKWYA